MLHIHRAERADRLVAALSQLLAVPQPDPLAFELVAVPTRGMERWLAQRLSSHLGAAPGRTDGVCAGVEFPPPRRLIANALAAASGVDPDTDPWLPERAAWPLLEVVEEHLHEPWLGTLAGYLGYDRDTPDPVRGDRRLAIVRHLATLFDRYGRHRPEMIRAWAAGSDDAGSDAAGSDDGGGDHGGGDHGELPPGSRWQAQLWRALRTRIDAPSPAERLDIAGARLRADAALVDLPPRVSLFGLTRLPAGDLSILRALAVQRDVHLFLLHPSPALWDRVAQAPGAGPCPREADATARLPAHPLLASWARDAREMQVVLRGSDAPHADHHHPLSLDPTSALTHLQAAILADEPPPGAPLDGEPDRRATLDQTDDSVQVHACHGQARQVEVLRDAVLHLLAADPSLEPRDVIVMCPDIETFAPLIQATFGAAVTESDAGASDAERGPVDLHVRLADRSLRQTNSVLSALAALLELAGQRVTASQVLGFADREPVRRRFHLRDDDLARWQRWIGDAGIRWGLDAAHRAPFKLDDLPTGTWSAGLDRVLLGAAMTEDGNRLFGGVLPLDDVESSAIDLAGRLGELVDRLGAALDRLATPQPLAAWASTLAQVAASLTATAPSEAWQHAELTRMLDELVAEAGTAAGAGGTEQTRVLTLAEVRGLLSERLAGRPTRANFRTGHMTVCTLYPMRSVPHRVVCLLGLDDGAFPRRTPRDGDDLMLVTPRVGERDPRSEDRQLLLDAVLAAEDHLIVTYTGHDERTNLPRPPAVPVGELLDVLDATVRGLAGRARDQIELDHPLQPFDPRNFARGAIVPERHWSFDRVALGGARALTMPRSATRRFLHQPLPDPDTPIIALDDLIRFVSHPVRAFLRQRLAVRLGEIDDEVDDALPVALDPLELWDVGQRLLQARLDGLDGNAAIKAEIARGSLPPGRLGEPVIRKLYPIVDAIAQATSRFATPDAQTIPIDVQIALRDGRLLSGTVTARSGDVLLTSTYSRLAPKHRLASWVRLVAATAAEPERALSAVTIGRARHRANEHAVMVSKLHELGADAASRAATATALVHELVDLYDRGLREPLPLPCATAEAYARAVHTGEEPGPAAREEWKSKYSYPKEDEEPEHVLAFGGALSLEDLLALPARDDERGDGWLETEPSRFARLAHRLWAPMLAREEIRTA